MRSLFRLGRTAIRNKQVIQDLARGDTVPKPDTHKAKQVFQQHFQSKKPSFFQSIVYPSNAQQYQSAWETVNKVMDDDNYWKMQKQAVKNLERYSQAKPKVKKKKNKVKVKSQDWGDTLLEETQSSGEPHAVLTCASADFPGGAWPHGDAQEEDTYMRTDASRAYFVDQHEKLTIDDNEEAYRYKPETNAQLKAHTDMSEEELAKLSSLRKKPLTNAKKVHLSPYSQLYFRHRAMRYDADPMSSGEVLKRGYLTEYDYPFVSDDQIIPFWDVSAAAPKLSDNALTMPRSQGGTDLKVDWSDPYFVSAYQEVTRQRVGAALDTLIINDIPYLISPDFGCGVYANKPEVMAEVFADELSKRKGLFSNVVFTIPTGTGYSPYNYEVFKAALDGLDLGEPIARDTKQICFFKPEKTTSSKTEEVSSQLQPRS